LRSGPDSGQTAAIVVVLLLLILSLVALAVFLAALWLRWRHRKQPYKKDEPLGEPEDSIHSPTAR
jgi:nitrate reductase gamma subunit